LDPLRIAFVCDGLTSMIGGAFVSTQRFMRRLRDRGHTVVLLTSRRPGEPDLDSFEGMKAYRFRSVRFPKTEGQLYTAFPGIGRIRRILQEDRIDLVHVTSPTPCAITAIRAARAMGIPVVSHSHTQPENVFLNFPKFTRRKSVYRAFNEYLLWIYRRAACTVCPSPFAQRLLQGIDSALPSTVISNGVDTAQFKRGDSSAFLKKFGIPANRKRLTFAGRMHPEKRIETLLNAMPRIVQGYPDVHAVIVGSGYKLPLMRKLAQELGIADHVTFCGHVTEEDLVLAQCAGDIFVFPSLAELEGMAVLEAMASGNALLIANSKESASVDFVQDNGLLFETDNSADLAEKALALLKDDARRQAMAARSTELSRQYDINTSVDRLEALYRSLIAKTAIPA
jgi:glycosyltransferase involved in cell wall biosynthesis